MLDSTLRGGQTALHHWRMWGQLSKRFCLTAVLSAVLSLSALLYQHLNTIDCYQLTKLAEAYGKTYWLPFPEKQSLVYQEPGSLKRNHYRPKAFLESSWANFHLQRIGERAYQDFLLSLAMGLLSALSLGVFWYWRGRRGRAGTFIRGAQKVPASLLVQAVKQHYRNNTIKRILRSIRHLRITPPPLRFQLGNMRMPEEFEYRHTLFCGSPGSGKSQGILELMDQIRAQGQKAIVYDIDQAFVPLYYRPGKDIILNPFDTRTANWNLWQDGKDYADFQRMAESLIPEQLDSGDGFWGQASRLVLASTLDRLKDQGCSTQRLLAHLFHEDSAELQSLLENTLAQHLVSDKLEKTALSLKATLAAYCASLEYLKEDLSQPLFSIKEWLNQDKDSWLFVSCTPEKKAAIKPLVSLWIDTAIHQVLSLKPDAGQGLWFFIDEFSSLHKLPSILDFLSRARKFRGALVAAVQSLSQIESVYGPKESSTLMGLFGTLVQYRVGDLSSAKIASQVLGKQETFSMQEGFSYGASDTRDGVNVQKQRREETLVMPSEIMNLKDLEAFIKIPGNFPISKINLTYKNRKVAENYI